jgi:hypothetical protein
MSDVKTELQKDVRECKKSRDHFCWDQQTFERIHDLQYSPHVICVFQFSRSHTIFTERRDTEGASAVG